MNDSMQRAILGVAWIPIVLLAGCMGVSGMHGVSSGGTSWDTGGDQQIPGIDQGTISNTTLYCCGPPAGVRIVIWSDLPNGSGGSSTGESDIAYLEGRHHGEGGRRIQFKSETTDGVTATVTIEGKKFHTDDGHLFLVSTKSKTPKILQLNVDVSKLRGGVDGVKAFANQHAKITEFFSQAAQNNDDVGSADEAQRPASPQ